MWRHTQGTHMLRYILLARRSQKQTSKQKASLYGKQKYWVNIPLNLLIFLLREKMEMEKRWEKKCGIDYPYTPGQKGGAGGGGISQDFSTVLRITDTHKFNKIINRILSCRSPLIQPLSHSWARRPLTHEGSHVWWGTPSPVKPI